MLASPVAKFLSRGRAGRRCVAALDAEAGDLLLIVADERPKVRHVLGLLRLELGRPPVNEGGFNFLWVVDFPLFEALDDDGQAHPRAPPVHHAPRRRRGAARRRAHGEELPRRCAPRPTTWCSTAGSWARAASGSTAPTSSSRSSRCSGIGRRGGPAQVRLPARRLPLRRPAARRLRLRHRPARGPAGGRGEHPRGHRLPEDPVGRRPAHRCPDRRSTRPSSPSSACASSPRQPHPPDPHSVGRSGLQTDRHGRFRTRPRCSRSILMVRTT